jgi:hypothetical protein
MDFIKWLFVKKDLLGQMLALLVLLLFFLVYFSGIYLILTGVGSLIYFLLPFELPHNFEVCFGLGVITLIILLFPVLVFKHVIKGVFNAHEEYISENNNKQQ